MGEVASGAEDHNCTWLRHRTRGQTFPERIRFGLISRSVHAHTQVTRFAADFKRNLLFWLSLIPFTTGWMGENNFAAIPVGSYGVILLLASVAYWLLEQSLIVTEGPDSHLARAVGKPLKEYLSLALYVPAIAIAPWVPLISCGCYVFVALMWLIPDPRIEKRTSSR